jgi:hypothetical protein
MKSSTLIHTFIALALIAMVPLGASAATPGKKAASPGTANEQVHPARKHYFAHNWLDS